MATENVMESSTQTESQSTSKRLLDLTRASNRSNDLAQAPLVSRSSTNEIEVTK